MNPLSPLTYHRRHKQRAALLIGLVCLMTLAVYLLYTLSSANFVESMRMVDMYLDKFNVVYPNSSSELDPTIVTQIRTHPDVAHAFPVKTEANIKYTYPLGGDWDLVNLMGLKETDAPVVMELCNATLVEGEMVQPRTNGVILTRELAASAGLQVGDVLDYRLDSERFEFVPVPLQVVGIMDSDVRLGIVSFEYLDSHLTTMGGGNLMVIPREGREQAVRSFLHDELPESLIYVESSRVVKAEVAEMRQMVNLVAIPISVIASLASALVISAINRITLMRRLRELGILHAMGFNRTRLLGRMMGETSMLAGVGFTAGLGLSWLALLAIEAFIFAPKGYALPIITLPSIVVTLPIPIAILPCVYLSLRHVLSRLDTVSIVEQGALSAESKPRVTSATADRFSNPHASITFYKRHRGHALLLVGSMALMIMSTVIAIFYLTNDIEDPETAVLRYTSRVLGLHGGDLDPGVVSQIRAHPTIDRAVPTIGISMFSVSIPVQGTTGFITFAVSEDDARYLTELYGLELSAGHLPRPRTNDVVISQALVNNRGLRIGDVIGNPNAPAYPGAWPLETEFVVSGIFSPPEDGADNWLSLASIEFVQSHSAFTGRPVTLLAAPRAGQKEAMDDWLEQELAGQSADVWTYRSDIAHFREATRSLLLTMALLESVLATVAAITLVVLNTIFVSQRQSELGVLNALGFSRLRLIWRTVQETVLTTGIAWIASIVLCVIGLIYQTMTFTSMGLSYDWANPTPWLFTLPIPIAVLLATSGTVAWTLSKLDPVSIIERR